jgi:hypothetical protein
MTANYKILGQTRPAANTNASNYVVPENKSALVKSININNTSSTADTYSVAFLDNGNSTPTSYTVFTIPYSNRVEISTDLITWTNASMPESSTWRCVEYGPQGWLASGFGGNMGAATYAKTTDLSSATWSSIDLSQYSFGTAEPIGSFYVNGSYYVYGEGNFFNGSTDLVSWTDYRPYLNNAGVMGTNSVAYGNGKFLSVPGATSEVWYSTDAITWGSSMISSFTPSKVSFVNNMFVLNPEMMLGSSENIAISTDAITWTISTIGYSSAWKSGVAYNNGKYVMVPYTNANQSPMVPEAKVAVSTDLITWTVNDLPPSGDMMFNGTYLKDVAFVNNHFVVSGEMSGKYYKSTDAVTWTVENEVDGMNDGIAWEKAGSASIAIAPTPQSADYIAYNINVDGNETITIKSGYTLSENNGIYVKSTNGTTTFSTFGAEIS